MAPNGQRAPEALKQLSEYITEHTSSLTKPGESISTFGEMYVNRKARIPRP
jgi:hypothetical protein